MDFTAPRSSSVVASSRLLAGFCRCVGQQRDEGGKDRSIPSTSAIVSQDQEMYCEIFHSPCFPNWCVMPSMASGEEAMKNGTNFAKLLK
jgi:hypothetical protein